MNMIEAKPLEENAESWKRENWLFTSTVLAAGTQGQIEPICTHSKVVQKFELFSLPKPLFLVRSWYCWSLKAFTRQMRPKTG